MLWDAINWSWVSSLPGKCNIPFIITLDPTEVTSKRWAFNLKKEKRGKGTLCVLHRKKWILYSFLWKHHIYHMTYTKFSCSLPGLLTCPKRKNFLPITWFPAMSRDSPSSPPHLVAGALFLARQWPVQLSPVPGGIADPQTVQTTTSAWNQAKGNGALEELFRMHLRQER